MNRQEVIENNLVERYLRGELDEPTRQEFELHYLENPETLEELRLVEAMREGMKALDRKTIITPSAFSAKSKKAPIVPYALAASMTLVSIMTTSLYWSEHRGRDMTADRATHGIRANYSNRLVFEKLRSVEWESDSKALENAGHLKRFVQYVDATGEDLSLDLYALEYDEIASYTVTLFRIEKKDKVTQVDESISVDAMPDQYVKVLVPYSLLNPGVYKVIWSTKGIEASEYFEVLPSNS